MKKNRRTFVKTTAAATAGLLCGGSAVAIAAEGGARLRNFGFISGIAEEALKADWKGTLRKAADYGFTEIEGGSNFAQSPQEFLAYCKEIGIRPIASAINFRAKGDELRAEFDKLNELGLKYAVIYWPWF